ncbi:MAG TPA: bacteriohemerythrin [Aquimonas sp.]|nr:bacteriohemerythrin [Xanthomonadales bacterium]HRF54207.1 bacteriohemerythrin [Aquimonas sp.]
MTIAWNAALHTGIDVIDQQHQRIVDYINRLEALLHSHDEESLSDILAEVVDYTLSHLAFEESLMEEAGYPLLKPHRAVHEHFTHRVQTYAHRFRCGEDIGAELYGMLSTWLVHHIQRDDMAYVKDVTHYLHHNRQQNASEHGWLARTLKRIFG